MERIAEALAQPLMGIYVRVLAVVLLYGAAMHVGNMLGLSGTPWSQTPRLFRAMDVVLLVFDLVVAAGLWIRKPWAVVAFVCGLVLLQILPYTLFRQHFVRSPEDVRTLNGLLGTELVLLLMLGVLLVTGWDGPGPHARSADKYFHRSALSWRDASRPRSAVP